MKTNLLYIFADQWRYHGVGISNQDKVITPCIDRFAGESMVFTEAYSTFPLCSPHRASLMTGKYPFSTGMWTNCKTGLEEKIMLKPQETCIANVLKENGYDTGYIGKWHLDSPELNFHAVPESGAVNWDAYTPPGERRQGFDYWLSYGADDNHLNPHYWSDSKIPIKPKKWSVEYETDKTIEYMQAHRELESPFALFVSYNPPHLPYHLVPDKYYHKFKELPVEFRENVPDQMKTEELKVMTRQYFAAIAGLDENFGRIYKYLKDNNMEENTLVVLSADHGEMLGSHGLMSKNVWYEEAIHIPLMLRQKGKISKGENDEIFPSQDHMPTLLDLLHMDIPETCEGYSHKKGMFCEDFNAPDHMLLCSYPGTAEMVCKFSQRGLNHKCYGFRGIKGKKYTYVINNGYDPDDIRKEYLYDNELDYYQKNNIIDDKSIENFQQYGCIIEDMRNKIRQYMIQTKDPFFMDGL